MKPYFHAAAALSAIEAIAAPRREPEAAPIFKPLSRPALYEQRIELPSAAAKAGPRRYRFKRPDESVN
jgi:hypothetical protein